MAGVNSCFAEVNENDNLRMQDIAIPNDTKKATKLGMKVSRSREKQCFNTQFAQIKSRAYTTLVRPMLEYSSAAWDPYRKYQVNCLEMVQRRAARFVTRTQGTDEGCVTRALNHLQWPTLESRRKVARLSLLHKTLHGKASVAMPSYVTHKPDLRTRGSHPMKFLTIQSNCDEYKNSFWPRTIREWNKLPPAVLDINNTELYKTKLTM